MEVLGVIFATLTFSVIAVPIALIPVGIVAICARLTDSRWKIPPDGRRPEREIPYVRLGVLGGLAGNFIAVSSLFLASWWSCQMGTQLCHDGQTGMLLIFTVPFFSFLGSTLSLIWTWLGLGMDSTKLFASVFIYNGPNRKLNVAQAIAVQLIFWPVLAVAFAWMTPR